MNKRPAHFSRPKSSRRSVFSSFATALLVLGASLGSLHAQPDLNSRNQGVWRVKYGATSTQVADANWLAADADGDGVSNGAELAAGTHPFSPSTTIRVTTIMKNGSNVDLTFPTVKGKRYQAQASTSLTAPNWTTQATGSPASVTGNDGPMTISVPYAANSFYRILVDDLDSDGDGISDWAEYAANLNPNAAQTTAGIDDSSYVDTQLQIAKNEVNIKATAPFASEDGPTLGTFVVSRTQKLLPATVKLSNLGSTAIAGPHYSQLPNTSGSTTTVNFPAGVDSITLTVQPNQTPAVEGSRSVKETLMAPTPSEDAFAIGANSSATVIINDSTAAAGTGLYARFYDTANTTYAHAANFGDAGGYAFTRGTPTTTGTIVVTPTTGDFSGLQVGHVVKLTFLGGNLNSSLYNHANYTVTATTATTFTVGITGQTTLPTSSSSTCNYSIQSYPHPGKVERIDQTVNFDFGGGTANGSGMTPANDNGDTYSSAWEGYLSPSTAGNYTFQLDADDKARVLLDTGSGLTQILEHGWDGPATVGTFKASAPIALGVPASPAQRYRIRVEHVETTGEARCRLQWKLNNGGFSNIPQGNVFSHTQAATYAFTRASSTAGTATITLAGHGLANDSVVKLAFSGGGLFTPNASDPAGYSGSYVVSNATANTFDVAITGTNLPANVAAGNGCFLLERENSSTTGWLNRMVANSVPNFGVAPGRVGIDGAGATTSNNGLYGTGSPDPNIAIDTFSARWSGQVQPQFTEEYTLIVQADDGCVLYINGQPQVLKMAPSAINGGSNYEYDSTTGKLVVSYVNQPVVPGSYIVGETVRIDPSTGALSHAPNISPTYTYDAASGDAVIDYTNLTVSGGTRVAGSFAVNEIIELDPTSGSATSISTTPFKIKAAGPGNTFTVNFGAGLFANGSGTVTIADTRNVQIEAVHASFTYSYTSSSGAATFNYSSVAPSMTGAFQVGNTIDLEAISGTLSSLPVTTCTITSVNVSGTTFNATLPTGLGDTSGTVIVRSVPPSVSIPDSANTAFTVDIGAGKYASTTNSAMNVDIINKSLKPWSSNGNERYVRLPMIGGVRYDIQLDYYESGGFSRCILSWYSPSQPKQVIPKERLYPSTGIVAPPAFIASTDASAMAGGSFSQDVAGSNGANVTISGNPAWLTYDSLTGKLVGTPPVGAGGDYQVTITMQNGAGTTTSVVNLHVDENAGSVAREYWAGVAGTSVASIPTDTAPTSTGNLSTLEGPTNSGNTNYGARIRGYITAPTTGNYYFWVAAKDAAELWISNDSDAVNAYKRAWVTAGSATPRIWNVQASQQSPWLALEQGRKYYFEVLHKVGAGPDNLAVGWAKPGEATTGPSEVIPGYVLSPYVAPSADPSSGTLFVATLLAQPGVTTDGVGKATLRLSEDENYAYFRFEYSGLSGPLGDWHIHADSYQGKQGGNSIVFYDGVQPPPDGPQPDGSHKWTITASGPYSKQEVIEILKEGKAYINLHTMAYPAGEIRGNFVLANGTRTFSPPPAPPAWTDDSSDNAAAVRFLTQATFGANIADIQALQAIVPTGGKSRYELWIDDQLAKPATKHLPEVLAREIADVFGPFDVRVSFDSWWKNSMTAPDQLRQRVAFALSQIHVVSGQGPLEDNSRAISYFYDTLLDNAFDNFRKVLYDTTLTPGMGRYLDMLGNDKPDISIGRSPNENYAREIKQLFSIGLFRMWPDGSLMLNSSDSPIDTYSQREIVGLAHVFTGWYYGYDGDYRIAFNAPQNWVGPMREVPARHFTGPKRVLNNEVLPGLRTLGGQPLDPYATHTSTSYNDPAYQALPGQELDVVHDMLFNHPNTGPFICRQLIQRLVTSNPSRDYLYRVVQKFNDNGSGVRGDMKAVIKAILLDYEARSSALYSGTNQSPAYGKQREPVLRVANVARAFRPTPTSGTYSQNGTNVITVTTTTSHLLLSGNSVFLEFANNAGDTTTLPPTTGAYSVLGSPAPTATQYSISAAGWLTGSYSQTAGSSTMTVTMNGHWFPSNGVGYFKFLSPTTGTLPTSGIFSAVSSTAVDFPSGVNNNSGTTFTIPAPDTTARTGTLMLCRLPGSYSCTGAGGIITIDTSYNGIGTFGGQADHHLQPGDSVFLNFTNSRDTTSFNETSTENDHFYTILTVPDANTFTVQADNRPNAAMNSDNQVVVFPQVSQPLVRNGTIVSRQGTYQMDNTDVELSQTPLNSPTVFNFFLPEYRFPGSLSSLGVTTPEFELTAETTVIRQANFIYSSIYAPANNVSIASFKAGTNALMLDLSPWLGNATDLGLGAGVDTTKPWTNAANLDALINKFSILLAADQIPSGAKTIIKNHVTASTRARQISSISQGSPATITTPIPHDLAVGNSVTVTGVTGGTFNQSVNATFTVSAVVNSTQVRLTNGATALNCTSSSGINVSNARITSGLAYSDTSNGDKRDRLNTILQLILTSPDFTIQR